LGRDAKDVGGILSLYSAVGCVADWQQKVRRPRSSHPPHHPMLSDYVSSIQVNPAANFLYVGDEGIASQSPPMGHSPS